MKIRNLFVLISVMTLVACAEHTADASSSFNSDSSISSQESIIPISYSESKDSSSNEGSSSSSFSSSNASTSVASSSSSFSSSASSSSSRSSSSSSSSSSSKPVDGDVLEINFYNNPNLASMSKEVISERLATFINDTAGTTFVNSIASEDSQVTNNIPNNKDRILLIGAASTTGYIQFNFAKTIKSITITTQTYHKPYTDWETGNLVPNVDTSSALSVAGKATNPVVAIDLAPTNGEPTERTNDIEINFNKITLSTVNSEKGRVFIKAITFIY